MSSRPAAARALVAAGRLQWHSEADRALFQHALAQHDGQVVSITVKRHAETRSQRQNRWYWGVIVAMLVEYSGHTAEEMHEFLKAKFLPEVVGALPGRKHLEIVDKATGEVVEEQDIDVPLSTTRLSTAEMSAFTSRILEWAAADLALYIPTPEGPEEEGEDVDR